MPFSPSYGNRVDFLLLPHLIDYGSMKSRIRDGCSRDDGIIVLVKEVERLEEFIENKVHELKIEAERCRQYPNIHRWSSIMHRSRKLLIFLETNVDIINKIISKFGYSTDEAVKKALLICQFRNEIKSFIIECEMSKNCISHDLLSDDLSEIIVNDDEVEFSNCSLINTIRTQKNLIVSNAIAKVLILGSAFKCIEALRSTIDIKVDFSSILDELQYGSASFGPVNRCIDKIPKIESIIDFTTPFIIHRCVYLNDSHLFASVIDLSQTRYSLTSYDNNGYNCLDYAIHNQNPFILEEVLRRITDQDFSGVKWKKHMQNCCSIDASSCLQLILEYVMGQAKSSTNDYSGLIHMCCMYNAHNCLRLLVSKGVDINFQDRGTGRSALIESIRFGSLDCSLILINNDCNVGILDRDGWTAKDHAVYRASKVFYHLPIDKELDGNHFVKFNRHVKHNVCGSNAPIDEDVLYIEYSLKFFKDYCDNPFFLDPSHLVQVQISTRYAGLSSKATVHCSPFCRLTDVVGEFSMPYESAGGCSSFTPLIVELILDNGKLNSLGSLNIDNCLSNDSYSEARIPLVEVGAAVSSIEFHVRLCHIKKFKNADKMTCPSLDYFNENALVRLFLNNSSWDIEVSEPT